MTAQFHPDLTWEGEDTAALLLRFEGGTIGELIISYAFDAPTTGDERLFTVVGRDGTLSGDEAQLLFCGRESGIDRLRSGCHH